MHGKALGKRIDRSLAMHIENSLNIAVKFAAMVVKEHDVAVSIAVIVVAIVAQAYISVLMVDLDARKVGADRGDEQRKLERCFVPTPVERERSEAMWHKHVSFDVCRKRR